MKFTAIVTLAIAVNSAWASPAIDSVGDIANALEARSEGAEFFHVGNDHVLRAISAEFKVVGRQALEARHVEEWGANIMEDMVMKRSVVDEAELLQHLAAVRRDTEASTSLEARQGPGTCINVGCFGGCGSTCRCDLGNLSSRCIRR